MTAVAILFLILAILLVWGGLVASTIFLSLRPGVERYPAGGEDDSREDLAPIEHDT